MLDSVLQGVGRTLGRIITEGDFNPCIGGLPPGDDLRSLGWSGVGRRNDRGVHLANWILAHTKARQAPALLRHSLTNALIHRWSAMLTHAAMHAFAQRPLHQTDPR